MVYLTDYQYAIYIKTETHLFPLIFLSLIGYLYTDKVELNGKTWCTKINVYQKK